jgi:hypothetical protein
MVGTGWRFADVGGILGGLGEDVKGTVFDEKGTPGWTTRHTYLVESGQPLVSSEMMGNAESSPNKRVSALQHFGLLPDDFRGRY